MWTYLGSGLSKRKECNSMSVAPLDFMLDLEPPLARDMKWPTESQGDICIRDVLRELLKPLLYAISQSNVPSMYTWNADGTCNNGAKGWRLLTPEEIAKKKKK